jgi:hypothetical protein
MPSESSAVFNAPSSSNPVRDRQFTRHQVEVELINATHAFQPVADQLLFGGTTQIRDYKNRLFH